MYNHTIINTVGGLYVKGDNTYGQLGIAGRKIIKEFTRVDFDGFIESVYFGRQHTIITTDKGLFACGRYGTGLNDDVDIFTKVDFDYDILSIHCGGHFTFINTTEGLFSCGCDSPGQNEKYIRNFTKIEFLHVIKSIHCGDKHIVINTTDGLYGSGDNVYGQLGLGYIVKSKTFVRLNFNHDIKLIECGICSTAIYTTNRQLFVAGDNSLNCLNIKNEDYIRNFTIANINLSVRLAVDLYIEPEIISIHLGYKRILLNTFYGLYGIGLDCSSTTLTKVFDKIIKHIYNYNYHVIIYTGDEIYRAGIRDIITGKKSYDAKFVQMYLDHEPVYPSMERRIPINIKSARKV